MKIEFPALVYIDSDFIVADQDWFQGVRGKFTKDGHFSKRENLRRKSRSGWIIDYTGQFIELHPVGKEREMLRPLASVLWNWVRSIYVATAPRSVTVAEVITAIDAFPVDQSRKQLVKDFARFLSDEDPHAMITRDMLDRWPI